MKRDVAAGDERGVLLIIVAISITVMMMLGAFVFDMGMLWLGRVQAQNAADAGALAGGTALILDDGTDLSPTGPAYLSASVAAQNNGVFGGTHGVHVDLGDGTGFEHPAPAQCASGGCVQVDVYQDGTHTSSTIPTLFGVLWGQTSQGIRATATAQVLTANGESCLKPWVIPDLWQENGGTPLTYDVGVDNYEPPIPGPPVGGYTVANIGDSFMLNAGAPGDAIAPGIYFEADLSGGGGGTNEFIEDIKHCSNVAKMINSTGTCVDDTDPTCMNVLTGRRPNAVIEGIEALINADLGASMDDNGVITGSCAPNCVGYEGQQSPRLVPVAMFNPRTYAEAGNPSGNQTLPIVNIMSIWIESIISSGQDKGRVTARIAGEAGELYPGPAPGAGSGFLTVVKLIR
jgi:hypothetical protein